LIATFPQPDINRPGHPGHNLNPEPEHENQPLQKQHNGANPCKNFARFDITMRDGNKTQFLRSTALHLAEQFIRTGRDSL